MTTCPRIADLFSEYSDSDTGIPSSALRRTRDQCGCESCRETYSLKQVRYVIGLMRRPSSNLVSADGIKLELARLKLLAKRGQIDEWRRHQAAEDRHAETAIFIWMRRQLSPLQRHILDESNSDLGAEEHESTWFVSVSALRPMMVPLHEREGQDETRVVFRCGATLKHGGFCWNQREAGEARCRVHHDPKARPATWVTSDGAEMLYICDDGRTAVVRGHKAKRLSVDDIGKQLPNYGFDAMSGRTVQRQLSSIYETLRSLPHIGLLLSLSSSEKKAA